MSVSSTESRATSGIGTRLAIGAGWMVLMRLADRAVGLVSTAVLARLLVPEDFGLVALAMSLIALLDMIGELSVELALIQSQVAQRRHYDTAWSLRIIKGALLAGIVFALGAPAARFFAEPQVEPVLRWLALAMLIGGFENIGIVNFRKELKFHREFLYVTTMRTAGTVVTIVLAFLWPGPWALVAGTNVRSLTSVALSYALHPYRPHWSLEAFTELFRFSRWIMIENVLLALRHRSHNFVLGRLIGVHALGQYSMAYEIAMMASSEIEQPIRRAVFPGYAKLAADPHLLRRTFLDVFGMIAALGGPVAAFVGVVAPLIVPLLLGPKWLETIPLIEVLSLFGLLVVLSGGTRIVYLALNKPYMATALSAVDAAVLVPMTVIGALRGGAMGVAWAMVATAVVMWFVETILVMRYLDLGIRMIVARLWRVFVALLGLALAVKAVQQHGLTSEGLVATVFMLVASVVTGAVVYIGLLFGLWIVTGRPDGAETQILAGARNVISRFHIRRGQTDMAVGVTSGGPGQRRQPRIVRIFLFRTGGAYPRLGRLAHRVGISRAVRSLERDTAARGNPRSRAFMERLATELVPPFNHNDVLVIDDDRSLGGVDWAEVDEIVLLWGDANGAGWGDIERKIFSSKRPETRVIVLNGRRRVFPLDLSTWRSYRARRFLEKTLVGEFAFSIVFLALTPWLWLADVVRRRRQRLNPR